MEACEQAFDTSLYAIRYYIECTYVTAVTAPLLILLVNKQPAQLAFLHNSHPPSTTLHGFQICRARLSSCPRNWPFSIHGRPRQAPCQPPPSPFRHHPHLLHLLRHRPTTLLRRLSPRNPLSQPSPRRPTSPPRRLRRGMSVSFPTTPQTPRQTRHHHPTRWRHRVRSQVLFTTRWVSAGFLLHRRHRCSRRARSPGVRLLPQRSGISGVLA